MAGSNWPGQARAALTLSFDDGFSATWEHTAGTLQARGLRATYHLIGNHVGGIFEGLPTASWDQWRQALAQGHEIASHGLTHRPMAGLLSDGRRLAQSARAAGDRRRWLRLMIKRWRALAAWKPAQAEPNGAPYRPLDEPRLSREAIEERFPGLQVTSFAYPSGRHDRAARRAVADAGYLSARGHTYGLNYGGGDRYALRAVGLGAGFNLADLDPLLEQSQALGGWLILVLHLVSRRNEYNYPYWLSAADFQRLLDRLDQAFFWVATQAEITNYLWVGDRAGGDR
jgi:peptidoglycan/xylan/chitin deacetylase (PgdA/CDA1 family)